VVLPSSDRASERELCPAAVLLEESKTASPLVIGAHLSEIACPRVVNTAMIFIFLPRLSLFYIMTHAAGATPVPFMRIPWLGCTHVLTVELSPGLNSLIAVAGNASDGKFRMRAWTILGDEGCSLDGLKLQPRNCSQNINHLEAASDAGVVSKRPDWAKLWSGNSPLPPASMQGSVPSLPHRQRPCRQQCFRAESAFRSAHQRADDGQSVVRLVPGSCRIQLSRVPMRSSRSC
jgi:hypothetical protein